MVAVVPHTLQINQRITQKHTKQLNVNRKQNSVNRCKQTGDFSTELRIMLFN